MTALLELKQKIKEIYGQYEMYILPVMKFVLALVYFLWINANMGYMSRLNNVFLVLILALICSILPSSAMMYIGFVLILVHSYALGIEIAAFMLVLILLMMIFFLRFSGEQNVTFVFTPLSFAFSLPALLPIGSGLMESSLSAIPAGCGVVMYYFIRFLRSQSTILVNPDLEMTDKLQIMADGLVQNWGMWIAVVAFVAVILLVHLIRTRSFDHAWRISIITGGVAYVFIMLVGSFGMNLNATVAMVPLLICTIAAVLLALVLEFFAFGGDYSRAERLEYEDDEYFYYVKAVPKASVATLDTTFESPIPRTTPIIPPTLVSTAASVRNCPRITFFLAPIAFFRPISLVRSVTDTSMIFITPIPPTRREILAIQISWELVLSLKS